MKLQLFFILLAIPFWSFAQKQDAPEREFRVEIYSDQFSHENLWWLYYKIDWDQKTIQYAQIMLNNGDEKPSFKTVKEIFKNAVPADQFIVLKANTIKVEKISRKRTWSNFATPRVKNNPAETYYIEGNKLSRKRKGKGYVLDKNLTLQFAQEKRSSGN